MHDTRHNSADIENWLRLINADSVGPKTFFKILKYFKTPDNALSASVSELAKIDGIGPASAEKILRSKDNFNVPQELGLAEKLNVHIINFTDPAYPAPLKKIPDPPPILYVKGLLKKDDNLSVALVGSRRCSLYGKEQAAKFSHLLGASGFTIVSGLARGIDTAAHKAALAANARTIAVLGCGLANIYPPENKPLFDKISHTCACISELPLTTQPLAENFPPRNRIIAGISIATIVVEATIRSGASITAGLAADYNREVLAVPGKIDSPLSKGTHKLIKEGAALMDSVQDLMNALGYIGDQLKQHSQIKTAQTIKKIEAPVSRNLLLPTDEKQIYTKLAFHPTHLDQIIEQHNFNPGKINACLISLRLKGLITQLPGNMFKKL